MGVLHPDSLEIQAQKAYDRPLVLFPAHFPPVFYLPCGMGEPPMNNPPEPWPMRSAHSPLDRFQRGLSQLIPADRLITDPLRTLAYGTERAGSRRLTWDVRDDAGRRVPGGIYFARLTSSGVVHTRRLVVTP